MADVVERDRSLATGTRLELEEVPGYGVLQFAAAEVVGEEPFEHRDFESSDLATGVVALGEIAEPPHDVQGSVQTRSRQPVLAQQHDARKRLHGVHPPTAAEYAQPRGNFHQAQAAVRIGESRLRGVGQDLLDAFPKRVRGVGVLRKVRAVSGIQQQLEPELADREGAAFEPRRQQRDLGHGCFGCEPETPGSNVLSPPRTRHQPLRWNLDLEFHREEVASVAHRVVSPGGRPRQWHPANGGHERDETRVEHGRLGAQKNGVALLALYEVHVEFAVQVSELRVRDTGRGNGHFNAFARCQGLGQWHTQDSQVVRGVRRHPIQPKLRHVEPRIEAEQQLVQRLHRSEPVDEVETDTPARIDGNASAHELDVGTGLGLNRSLGIDPLHPLPAGVHRVDYDASDSHHGESRQGSGNPHAAPEARAVAARVRRRGEHDERRRQHQHAQPLEKQGSVREDRQHVGSGG